MIATWMLYATLLGALFSVSALAAERVAGYRTLATRWGWIVALGATCLVPVVAALRSTAPTSLRAASREPRSAPVGAIEPVADRGAEATTADRVRPLAGQATAAIPPSEITAVQTPAPPRQLRSGRSWIATLDQYSHSAALNRALLLLWCLGSLGVVACVGRSMLALRRRRRLWTRTRIGEVHAYVSTDIGPAVFGLFRVQVVVPEWVLRLDQASLDLMLLHEREHARARDPLAVGLGVLAAVAMPWNPTIWWQLARLRSAIEIDCDARVLRGAIRPRTYASLLVAVSDRASTSVLWAPAFAEHRSLLERRITAMSERLPRRPLVAAAPFGLVALMAVTAAFGAPRPEPLRRVGASGDGGSAHTASSAAAQPGQWTKTIGAVTGARDSSSPGTAGTLGLGSPGATDAQGGSVPLVRQLGSRIAIAPDTVGGNITVRGLSDGRVIMNDNMDRRVVLFDAMLSHPAVLVDSNTRADAFGVPRRLYRGVSGGIAPFLGDSTLFLDAMERAMIVIDPRGHIGRSIAIADTTGFVSVILSRGNIAFDATGRATYSRVLRGDVGPMGGVVFLPGHGQARGDTSTRDTNLVVRGNPAGPAFDTVGVATFPRFQGPRGTHDDSLGRTNGGRPMQVGGYQAYNPIRLVDDAVILPDGAVAFVRGDDYHIDWVDANGARRRTASVPHDSHLLSQAEKSAIVDSARAWAAKHPRLMIYFRGGSGLRGGAPYTPDTSAPSRGRGDAAAISAAAAVRRPVVEPTSDTEQVVDSIVPPAELADRRAPFFAGARADAEGRLWIPITPQALDAIPPDSRPLLPGARSDWGTVFDIVNRQGQLIDRVQLPPGTLLAGFGPGVVYLTTPIRNDKTFGVGRALLASYHIQ